MYENIIADHSKSHKRTQTNIINQPYVNWTMSDDVFPNIQRKYSLRKRELGKQHMKGFQMALKNPDAYKLVC